MILTTLAEADAYAALNPGFAPGLAWLRAFSAEMEDGKYEIAGDDVFAMVQSYETGPATEKRFESHREYIDIQLVASGAERILHIPIDGLGVEEPYDPARDIVFYAEPVVSSSFLVREGEVAFFWPGDGHKPGCMAGGRHAVKKVVVKVRV
jgi:YhcH/YjgK/YiaL family protein